MKPFCVNETCPNFLPEDKRGYYKKKETQDEETAKPAKKAASPKSGRKTSKKEA